MSYIEHIFIGLITLANKDLYSIDNSLLTSTLLAQKWRNEPVYHIEDLSKIFELFDKNPDDRNFLISTFGYISQVSEISSEQMKSLIDNISSNEKFNLMTTYVQIIQK